ncbi:MAG: RNA polymerase sigma factor [Vicinamibacterales bacterium]
MTSETESEGVAQPGAVCDGRWSEATDADLVEATRAGRTEAFDVLVVRHQRAVYRICYRFAPWQDEASDLVQETFLRAYRALGSYRGQASFKTWIYRIAVNVGLSRAAQRTPATEIVEPEHLAANVLEYTDEAIDRGRRSQRVREAIDRLPPRQRAALIVKVLNDQSHEEAARVLGCSTGTVKANVFHALRKLRQWLSES